MNKTLYSLALASLLALGACSSEDVFNGGNSNANGEPVQLTLTVNRGDALTRTTLEENGEAGLTSKWKDTNETLQVYDANGNYKGFLTLTSGEGTPVGVFSGEVDLTKDDQFVNLFYYHEIEGMVYDDSNDNAKRLMIDLSKQSFSSVQDLEPLDILTSYNPNEEAVSNPATVQLVRKEDGTATVKRDVILKSKLAFARFSLSGLPEGANGTLQITDKDGKLYVKHGISYVDGERVQEYSSPDGITVTNVSADNDVFVALVPSYTSAVPSYTLQFKFTVNGENGKVYTCGYTNPTKIEAGVYYNGGLDANGNVQGAPLEFEEVAPEYDIIFMTYPEDAADNTVYDFDEVLTDPTAVPLPGNPDPDNHHEFLGWKEVGGDPTLGPWNLEENGPTVTLYPAYSEYYVWNIEWRSGYGDNELVEYQGQTTYKSEKLTNTNKKVSTPLGLGLSNPTREGFTFRGWANPSPSTNKCDENATQTAYQKYSSDNWTVVFTARWERNYEIVYHFNSATPGSGSVGDTNYNAMVTDRPTDVENGFPYKVETSTDVRFANQGGVAQTDAEGRQFIGWRKSMLYADDYNDDAEACARIIKEGDIWTFTDGKCRLHLEPVYEEAPKKNSTTSTDNYEYGGSF